MPHRLMNREASDLEEHVKTETKREGDDDGPAKKQVPGTQAAEGLEMSFMQVGNFKVGFTGQCVRTAHQKEHQCRENTFDLWHRLKLKCRES